jgi:hypothetical protein
MKSSLFSLNWADLGKSLLIIVGTPIVASIGAQINAWAAGGDFLTWVMVVGYVKVGVAAGVAYIVKQFFTNSDNKLAAPEPPKE